MTDRPILFSAPMIRALLEGRKTQTRRVLKPQPEITESGAVHVGGRHGGCFMTGQHTTPDMIAAALMDYVAPYAPGDRLWVREAYRFSNAFDGFKPSMLNSTAAVQWEADKSRSMNWRDNWQAWDDPGKLRPAMFMPRWASRLTLIVESVKVERLRDISRDDAIAEGATARKCERGDDWWSMDWSRLGQPGFGGAPLTPRTMGLGTPVNAFGGFINELHDPKWNYKGDGIFGANPWVCAITFNVIRANIDAAHP